MSREDTSTHLSNTLKFGAQHLQERGDWTETVSLSYQFERFEVAGAKDTSYLLIPGIAYGKIVSNSPIYTNDGYRLNLSLRGSLRGAISNATFLQAIFGTKFIFPAGEDGRFVTRAEVGTTLVPRLQRLPASIRFFAGGDTSVRGFAQVGAVYNADLHDTSMKVAGGGFVSTAEDLVRFGVALNTGSLLKKESVERMWTEQQTPDGKGTGYGLGFGVTPAQEGIRRLSHSGNQAGAASLMVILPEVGVTYAVMSNREDAELGPLSRGIANALRATFMGKQ